MAFKLNVGRIEGWAAEILTIELSSSLLAIFLNTECVSELIDSSLNLFKCNVSRPELQVDGQFLTLPPILFWRVAEG